MRRILLFLVLFGGSLGILVLAARLRDGGEPERPSQAPLRDPPVTFADPTAGPEDQIGVVLQGELEFTRFAEGRDAEGARPRLFQVEAADVRPIEADVYDLAGLSVWMYEPETGELRALLTSPLTRSRVASITGAPNFAQEDRVHFQNVKLELLSGADIVPATLDVPTLEANLAGREFRSTDRVTFVGRGLDAEGTGLFGSEEPYVLRFERDGEVHALLPHGGRARLAATGAGPLEIRRLESLGPGDDGVQRDLVQVRVEQGARLDLVDEEVLRVEAGTFELRGVVLDNETFQILQAYAEGDVELQRNEDLFSGERADFEFVEDGRLAGATLQGDPRGTVFLPDPDGEDAPPVRLDVTSEGRLDVDLLPRPAFVATGPTRVEAPELELSLQAREQMTGVLTGAPGNATLTAQGDVHGEFAGSTFHGQDLRVDVERVSGEEPRVAASTRSPSRLGGLDDRGRPVTVELGSGVDLHRRNGGLFLPQARLVTIGVEGEDGFELRAGEVRDLDWEARTFAASGGVTYRAGAMSAVAREARTLEGEQLELLAGPGEPVRMDLAAPGVGALRRASLRGQRVVVDRSRATAEGRVHVELEGPLDKLALNARSVVVDRLPDPDQPDSPYTPWSLRAEEVTRGRLEGRFGEVDFAADRVNAAGQALRTSEAQRPESVIDFIEADGRVELDWRGDVQVSARGERLVYNGHTQRGRLEAAAGQLVEAHARLVGGLAYRFQAEAIELEPDAVRATRVQARLEDSGLPRRRHKQGQEPVLESLGADSMHAEADAFLFSGSVLLEGRLADGVPWSLRAGHVWARLAGTAPGAQFGGRDLPVRHLVAWDGYDLRYGLDMRSTGELLEVRPELLRMEGRPARLEVGELVWESPLIEYDPVRVLVNAERGRVLGSEERFQGWGLEYESLQPFEQEDSILVTLRGPRMIYQDREVRAEWALLWIDRHEWEDLSSGLIFDQTPAPDLRLEGASEHSIDPVQPAQDPEAMNLFRRLDLSAIAPLVNEVYIEGNVEYLVDGELQARMGALYFDLVDGHGWLQDAELYIDVDVRGQPGRVVVAAEWLRHSADGSLRADNATVTTCTHEVPHFFVRTRDLRLTPDPTTDEVVYDVSLRRNSLRFRNGLSLPLPRLGYPSDGRGLPVLPAIRFGRTARFGQFLAATISRDMGAVGDAVGRAMGAEEEDPVSATARYRASYLGNRGVGAGLGAEIAAPDLFWINAYVDGVYDTGEDRGLVRAPSAERDDLRHFWRVRGRLHASPGEWFDLAFATQSDEGVQAEFFEGELLEYEERDTYLHWRKASGPNYSSASIKLRVDEFRNEIEELPSVGAFSGLSPLFEAAGHPVYFRGSLDAALLRRRLGDGSELSPFDPMFLDGVAEDRQVQRIDGAGRLELPLHLGRSGVTLTPFTGVRSTVWSEGLDTEDSPSRHALLAGAQLGTTFWRRTQGGWLHDITPRLGVRSDLVSSVSGGPPLPIDATEDSVEGLYVDADVRVRWWRPDAAHNFDLDVRLTHASDRAGGEPDGILPVAILGQFLTEIGGDPVGLLHDGRYKLDAEGTDYNRTALGWEPSERLAFETGYMRGTTEAMGTLFEAVTLATRVRGTGSWEAEARQTYSLRDGGSLDSQLVLRRYGHDLIFEIMLGRRSGEGGNSFSLGIDPRLGWRRPRLGLLDSWLRP